MDGPVVFVNRFTVHGTPEEFEKTFAETSAYFGEQPGFLGHTLLRHTEDPGSYVNVAHWRDAVSFRRAVSRPEFTPHQAALRALSTGEPNLYTCRQSRTVTP
ncbi:antibiotic biosynthesis monooxygenase family protein [Micromonospora aurantiaca]|uniref:antibiotic biosynthesis monooxygenase family protein n=1 Tax=Micromonospora TaxID=1873 RepID=UPI0010759B43|nr:antibiotic biosynthesis monooxygenase family protein [Micromonospora sp. BRA006-A]MDW3848638.1 antibiotic biosynthesis monooxygenase [Micromonospora sp. BRA006-A]